MDDEDRTMGLEKFVKELRELLIQLPLDRFLVLSVLAAMLIVAWALQGAR
jgi:hypothetical protein